MTIPEIRQFNVDVGRGGEITTWTLCNGLRHFTGKYGFVPPPHAYNVEPCDGRSCIGPDSQPLDPQVLGPKEQFNLGFTASVPPGHVLVIVTPRVDTSAPHLMAYNPGDLVAPAELEAGVLLPPGTGVFLDAPTYNASYPNTIFVQNVGGRAKSKNFGKPGRWWARWRTKVNHKKLIAGLEGGTHIFAFQLLLEQLVEAEQLQQLHPQSAEIAAHIERISRIMDGLLVITTHEAATGAPTSATLALSMQAETIGLHLDTLESWLTQQGLIQ